MLSLKLSHAQLDGERKTSPKVFYSQLQLLEQDKSKFRRGIRIKGIRQRGGDQCQNESEPGDWSKGETGRRAGMGTNWVDNRESALTEVLDRLS